MTAVAELYERAAPTGGRLVTADGRELPLQRVALRADAAGGLARVVLEQHFRNPHEEPLAVTYQVPLPADAAVSGYAFLIGERRIHGEVDRASRARERFEEAVAEGRTAALLEQDRSSLFTQELGNVPPGAAVVAELTLDQPLRWLPEGSWEWRFPTTVEARYLGAAGRVPDADRVEVDVLDGLVPARLSLSLQVRDALADGRAAESPSHAIQTAAAGDALDVALRDEEGAALDRDVVVRWPVAQPEVGVALDVARPADERPHSGSSYGLLTVVPPLPEVAPEPHPRDLIVLIDTSGSMGGEPLDQARSVVTALIERLGESDRLELISFALAPSRWGPGPVAATAKARARAIKWLRKRRAGGATEMHAGIAEALRPLRARAQRQVLLVTDGQIGFESEIVAEIRQRLPKRSRLHTLGVGNAVNRSLTGPAARAGRGREAIVATGEDPAPAAERLLAHMHAPLVTGLEIGGAAVRSLAPARLPDLCGAGPVRLAVELDPKGGALFVRGATPTGPWERSLEVPPVATGEGSASVVTLFGRERIEDLELEVAAGERGEALDRLIEEVGLHFQIASRLTSWFAATDEATVDPREPIVHTRIPHMLPRGVSVEGLGLRRARGRWIGAPPAAPTFAAVREMRSAKGLAQLPGAADAMVRAPSAFAEAPLFERGAPVPAVPLTLRGRIRRRSGDELVVELRVAPDEIEWDPAEPVVVVLADGRRLDAELDLERSTRAGPVKPGRRVRLVLRVAALGSGKPQRVELQCAGETLLVMV